VRKFILKLRKGTITAVTPCMGDKLLLHFGAKKIAMATFGVKFPNTINTSNTQKL